MVLNLPPLVQQWVGGGEPVTEREVIPVVPVLEDAAGESAGSVFHTGTARQVCHVNWVARVLLPLRQLRVGQIYRPAQALAAWVVAKAATTTTTRTCRFVRWWSKRSNIVDQYDRSFARDYRSAPVERPALVVPARPPEVVAFR